MAVGFIRFDLRIRLSLRFKELKLLTRINISTSMTRSQTFSESLQSGHAEILSVFPVPIWNFELNIFMLNIFIIIIKLNIIIIIIKLNIFIIIVKVL